MKLKKLLIKIWSNKLFRYSLIGNIIGTIIMFLALNVMQNYELLGWVNATMVAFAFIFLFISLVIVANYGAFDIFSYSLKAAFKKLRGKKMDDDYFTYKMMKSNSTNSSVFILYIASLYYFIATTVLHIIYYSAQ